MEHIWVFGKVQHVGRMDVELIAFYEYIVDWVSICHPVRYA